MDELEKRVEEQIKAKYKLIPKNEGGTTKMLWEYAPCILLMSLAASCALSGVMSWHLIGVVIEDRANPGPLGELFGFMLPSARQFSFVGGAVGFLMMFVVGWEMRRVRKLWEMNHPVETLLPPSSKKASTSSPDQHASGI